MSGTFKAFLLLASLTVIFAAKTCDPKSLAAYNVTFTGLWSKEAFPKQYPLFRPPAQWTKVLGRSHGTGYNLFSLDKPVSPAVKQFVESGITQQLDLNSQGEHQILDIFTTAAVRHGVGQASAMFFADGLRSKVSMISRIVPSPDWFVGVDSLELCEGGKWRDTISINLDPMDAGTDQGYTFTAPNWPEEPQKAISMITSHNPNHPANSFYYPDKDKLPTIARLEFSKVSVYRWASGVEPAVIAEPSPSPSKQTEEVREVEEKIENIQAEQQVQEQGNKQRNKAGEQEKPATTELPTTSQETSSEGRRNGRRKERKGRKFRQNRPTRKSKEVINALDIAEQMVDCEVSDWGAWAACSKTCGFGIRTRVRTVMKEADNYGHPCPLLTEDELCGSMRSCGWSHFQGMGQRFEASGNGPQTQASIFRFGQN